MQCYIDLAVFIQEVIMSKGLAHFVAAVVVKTGLRAGYDEPFAEKMDILIFAKGYGPGCRYLNQIIGMGFVFSANYKI